MFTLTDMIRAYEAAVDSRNSDAAEAALRAMYAAGHGDVADALLDAAVRTGLRNLVER